MLRPVTQISFQQRGTVVDPVTKVTHTRTGQFSINICHEFECDDTWLNLTNTGKITLPKNLYYRDEMFSADLDLVNNPEESTRPEMTRVLTEKTSKEYELINKKYYLARETEWLTRINEPFKAVKVFQYFDKNGDPINASAT